MPGMWDGMRRAAISGAARATVGAEQAMRRVDLQRRIAERLAAAEARYAAVGRLVAGTVEGGAAAPAGAAGHLEAARAADAEVAALRAELDALTRGRQA